MTTQDFIMALFYAVDQERLDVPKRPDAKLYPSEVVTLALRHAIKGGGTRAFYRWLTRDYWPLCPQVPERTRWARLFKTHTAWTARFLAAPTVLGVADSYGIELIHPMREGRSADWEERAKESSLDGRREARLHCEPMGLDVCLGLCHRHRPRHPFSPPDGPVC